MLSNSLSEWNLIFTFTFIIFQILCENWITILVCIHRCHCVGCHRKLAKLNVYPLVSHLKVRLNWLHWFHWLLIHPLHDAILMRKLMTWVFAEQFLIRNFHIFIEYWITFALISILVKQFNRSTIHNTLQWWQ